MKFPAFLKYTKPITRAELPFNDNHKLILNHYYLVLGYSDTGGSYGFKVIDKNGQLSGFLSKRFK